MNVANGRQKIAFLGIGLMGRPMAIRLLQAGYPVRAWNRTSAKAQALNDYGATTTQTLAEAVHDADVVITMLEAGPVVLEVIKEIAPYVASNAIVIDMSSTTPAEARVCATQLDAAGAHFIDAPVSGGVIGAEAGNLAIMAGGEQAIYVRVESLLSVMGRPTRVGPTGSGQLAKLCNQLIVGGTLTIVAEALLLAQAGGADPVAVRLALRGGFAESRILEVHGQRMLDRNFMPGGQVKSQAKDMANILSTAEAGGVSLPATNLVANLYRQLLNELPHADHSAVLMALEALNTPHRVGASENKLP